MEQQWEESEKILSWREMQPGVYMYHGIEHRSANDCGRPISVVTLERTEVMKMYYAPSSLYWDLKNDQKQISLNMKGTKPLQRALSIQCSSSPNERQTQRAI